jgi:hypothetical protein
MIPVLQAKSGRGLDLGSGQIMRYATTPEVSRLTGLSIEKLREWTSRRALIPADIRPKRQGSPAKYSWQAVLLLRIAVTLRERFRLELQAHRDLFASLRRELRKTSFIALGDKVLALEGEERWRLIDANDMSAVVDDVVLIRLNPHLDCLAQGFALPSPAALPGQLELFPARPVTAQPVGEPAQFPTLRRRSAAPVGRRSA